MFLILTVSASAWADYTITFKTGSGSEVTTKTAIVNSGGDYVSSVSAAKTYAESAGLRYGSGSAMGYTTFTLSNAGQIKASKIIFQGAKYYSSDNSSLQYTITYTDDSTTSGTIALSSTATNKEATLESSKTISKIDIRKTANKDKRFYVQGVKVVSAAVANHTVTFDAGSGSCSTPNFTQTSTTRSIDLPTATTTCEGWTFAGWCTFSAGNEDENSTSPGTILLPGDPYTPNSTHTLYAIYTRSEDGASATTTESYGFEDTDNATNWTINGPVKNNSYKKTGSYAGKINSNDTYIAYKEKVNVTSFSFQFMRESTNNNYNVYIETSPDNQTWTPVETYAMSSFTSKLTWYSKSHTFDGKTALYIRFHCNNTTAVRWVDDVSITYVGGATTYYMTDLTCSTQTAVTLNPNGGAGGTTSVTATYGQSMPTITPPTRAGYDFQGYFTATSGGTKYYNADGTSAKNWDKTSTATLYAQWECVTPNISTQPQSATYLCDDDADALSVVAAASDATLTYQWQKSTDNSTWLDITGATEATYKPSTQSVGTTYYQVVVTNSEGNCSATSDVAIITVRSANCKWVETEIGDIESGDEVVIAMTKSGYTWALNSSKGTDTYPPATQVSIENLTITSNEIIWNISGNATDGYVFYPNGSATTWLYCTGSNNTVKVGTGTAKTFYIENNYLKNTQKLTVSGVQVDAYVGVSISTSSWRHYPTTTGTSVIADQTLKLYKKECLPTGKYWINYDLTNVVCTDDPIKNKISTDDNAVELNFEATGEHNELPTTIIVTNGSTTLTVNTDYTWNNATGVLTLNPSQITDNITISIAAQKRNYTVTFDANGHGTAPAEQTITAEGIASEPTAPEATGYTFGGWYKEPECTTAFDFATPITGNITLYAKWTVNKYTITFKNYDGTELQSSEVAYGETPAYTGAAPTREQTAQYTYTFSGWSPALYPADKDQEYTAQFNTSTRQYTVTWYDGTGNAHKTQTANYNATVALPTTNPDPCDDEYPHFIGWTADPITGSTTTQPELVENVIVTGDCDYYAVFAKGEAGENGSYTLDYTAESLGSSNKWGSYGTAYEHTAKDGSTWVIKAYKNAGMQINTGKNASIKIPACPSPITSIEVTGTTSKAVGLSASDYTGSGTITYIVTGQDNKSQTLDFAGKNVTNGYIVAKSGSISITKITVNFTAPTNYTSFITTCCTSWTAPTLTYTTPLEENGTAMPQLGAGTTHGTVTYASSNPSILSVNSTTGEISAQTPGTATVTATWSGDEIYCSVSSKSNVITVKGSFSVIFEANGGTGTMANQKADENNKIVQLNANQFTRDGYAFVGWNTTASGTGTAYADQATNITLTQNRTLYAQWAAIVTLNDAGNETTTHPATAGGSITLEDGANACDPYEFVGWTAVATGGWNEGINEPALVATTYTPNAPTTLYAVYKIQSEENANAFKLSYEVSGTTYYVGSINSDPYIKGFSNITADNAVTFYKEKIENNTEKYWVYFEKYDSYYDETTKEYLYLYDGNDINTTNSPSETQGWIMLTLNDGRVQFKDITVNKYLSFSDSGNLTDHSEGNQKSFNLLPAVSSTYYAIPDCDKEIKITFETGNGDFVANTPATNPLVVTSRETITLPICEYPGEGIEFIGWLKNTPQEELSDAIADGYYEGGEEYVVDDTRDVIFYAYYKVTPEEVEFTGQDDAELKIYHYNGVDNYYYANTFAGEHAELAGIERCFDATTWKFTNVGNMQYYIQDETGKYLRAVSDSDNDFSLSNTPKIWNFTLIDGLWRMICEDSPSRALMYISTGKKFVNAALTNISNSAYSYVTLGICPDDGYTTQPVLTQGFVVTNTAMVTSAVDQKVKAASALTLETRNIELPCTFTITAPNITFYDNTGAEVTQLTASAASEQFELYFAYKPTVENTMEYPTITIVDDEMKTYAIKNRIYARSLPNTFAVVAKVGGIWYALPSQGLNSTTPPAAYPVEVDNMADPTAVAAVPANADWSLRQVYASSGSNNRFADNGEKLVFVNDANPQKALNAGSTGNYLLTDAQYDGYHNTTNPGLYEWTPTTTDLETYQLTNEQRSRTLSVNTATVFGVHATDKAVEQVRFLPIQNRYIPAALQVVEWKENSVVVMYNGDPAQTASVSVNGGAVQTTELSGDGVQKDIAVYELAADGLATNPTQSLSITIGTEKAILPIPYIVSSETTDLALLPGDATVAARQEVAKVADLVVLKDAKLTAAGAKSNPYKFRNVTIYGGGKLVIPSDKGFGVASLTLRAGGITDAGEYDYVYPQFELRGTFTNSAGKFYYDYITDYDHWYHLVLPFAGDLTIKYPTEFYGANVAANNTGSWQIKRYAGEIRATGNYDAWVDIETEGKTSTTAGQGYIFWGAPKKVSVNGGASTRQKWGIQRITMSVTAPNAMTAENEDKTLTGLSSHKDVANNSGKDNDQGWNLIGNPYMVNLTDMSTAGLHACKLVEVIDPATGKWNGQWEWNDETNIRYLTIPSDHFDTYTAKTVTQAVPLVPGRAFFVQLEGEANGITFATANRASLMPALLAENNDKPVDIETGIVLSNETLQDEVNFWIKDGKTNDYEYNADYPKTPNNTNFNIYGVHINGNLSWVATGPEYAEESMPIGYQVPAAGTYTLSISETYYSDLLDALYVTDHAMSPEVTVDLMAAPYEFSVNQAETNNERFTISVKLKSESQGPTTGLENTGVQRDGTIKFIYQDKIFILHHGKIYDATGKQITTINK